MNPNNTTDKVVLQAYQEQLGRALQNPNLAASVIGSPENEACLQRIEDVRAAIEGNTTVIAIRQQRKQKQKPAKKRAHKKRRRK